MMCFHDLHPILKKSDDRGEVIVPGISVQKEPEEKIIMSQQYRICHNCGASLTPDQAYCPRYRAEYIGVHPTPGHTFTVALVR